MAKVSLKTCWRMPLATFTHPGAGKTIPLMSSVKLVSNTLRKILGYENYVRHHF